MAKKNPKVNVALQRTSWQNIFDTIRSNKESIPARGNFWTALQEIERQVFEDDNARAAHDPNRPKSKPRSVEEPAFGVCEVCEAPLMSRGGYGGTGMCGPCTTGEADTIGE